MVNKQRVRFMWAMGAGIVGTCCYVAAEPGFDLVPGGIAKPVGIGFFLVSGLLWAAFGFGAAKEE